MAKIAIDHIDIGVWKKDWRGAELVTVYVAREEEGTLYRSVTPSSLRRAQAAQRALLDRKNDETREHLETLQG